MKKDAVLRSLEAEQRRKKAYALRYKKPIAKELNLDSMKSEVYSMLEELEDVGYVTQNDEIFISVMDGDEDEAFEYRSAFEVLDNDLNRFLDDCEEEYIPECFDVFMAAVAHGSQELLGYDMELGDYYGLGSRYMEDAAAQEARKKVQRMNKDDMMAAAQGCFAITVAYLGLRSRFGDLKSALDVIRGKNAGLLKDIDRINELYEHQEDFGWRTDKRDIEFQRLTDNLPDECWLR